MLKSTFAPLLTAISLTGLTLPALALEETPVLSSDIAIKAAQSAIAACRQEGYGVTATVVNPEGNVLVVIRSDGALVHTVQTSFNKAYSAVTLATNHNLDSTSGILASMQAKGAQGVGTWPMPADPLTGITLFPGGVRLLSQGKVVGGLGVSGTPVGMTDEGCAIKGRDAILPDLR
ncbi:MULTISPECIES: heme-binding protein [unclassified Synechocystis]|uniref:GlcG/HbpS family heme-binding protein n=1 Tax=unclassified Synechocystis TaxID=2640012 RepID=UPI00041EB5A9|nr:MULTISPECIES: heme-binding protein [unclassified Synechocystis]AIE73657.1 putative extracellular protein containing predicted 35aa signal peptide [Synechocystis sp. PCC 6714]MCT0255015.1 heme-binding protein [Synechocystis sp. CS-94]